MKNIVNFINKKNLLKCKLKIFAYSFFIILLFSFILGNDFKLKIYAQDNVKNLFFDYIIFMEKMLPDKFTSKLFTNIFDQDIKDMPDSFFINKKNIYFIINYEKGKDIKIDSVNIKDEYKSFFVSKLSNEYFFIFLKDSKYIIDNFKDYNIVLLNDKNTQRFFIYQQSNDFSYYIDFDQNKIFSAMIVKYENKDFLNAKFFYKIKNKFLIPERIEIYFYETKEKIFFKFEDLKF